MQVKAAHPAELLQDKEPSSLLAAYFEICQLKHLYRQGWLRRGVSPQRCESVADHVFGVAILAIWFIRAYSLPLDEHKVLLLVLLHEIGEVYAGDITPGDAINPQEKQKLEAQSVTQVLGKLPHGEEYVSLWWEFETGESPEAQFVRQLDRLEMGLQAAVYRAQGLGDMREFFNSAYQSLKEPPLFSLLQEAERLSERKNADLDPLDAVAPHC